MHAPKVNDLGYVMSLLDTRNRPNELAPLTGRQLVTMFFRLGWIDKAVTDYVKHKRTEPSRGSAPAKREAWDRKAESLRKRIKLHSVELK
jgi:hypothetical protein